MIIRNLALVIALAAAPVAANAFKAGDRLPDLSIEDKGEIVLQNDKPDYQPWQYPQQPGKVHVLQYMAATKSASELNNPFIDRIKTDFPDGTLLSTTILNMDEALWGTGGFVISELESNKKEFPRAVIVADEDGKGLTQWQLEEDSAAIVVTDPKGQVLFFKQGAMTPAEVESALQLIKQHSPAAAPPTAMLLDKVKP
jgi:YtfJ family uncharacterized protein